MTEEQVRNIIKEELQNFVYSDRYIFNRLLQMQDGRDVMVGRTTGTKFGTASDQKIGFYGKAPLAQQTGVAVTAGGIHAALVSLGLITA